MISVEFVSRRSQWGTASLFAALASLSGCFPDPPPAAIGDGSEIDDSEKEAEADEVGDSEIAEGVDTDTSVSEVEPADGRDVDSDAGVDVADGETEPSVNGCGGDGVLTPGEAGAACGPCLDGELVCVASDSNLNTTICENATTFNVCGGCGKLAHELQDPCDECGLYGCDPVGSTEVVCIEPAAGCFAPMLCDDLACETQGRLCIEGDADTDAVCGDCLDEYVAVDAACLPEQLPPENVTASTDRANDVEVRWDAAVAATGYRVFRCDAAADCADDAAWSELTESPVNTRLFVDETVEVPTLPLAPDDISASTDLGDVVVVTWAAVLPPSARSYSYRVNAVGPAGESVPSEHQAGAVAPHKLEGYQIEVDGAWTNVAGGLVLRWEDANAPSALLSTPTASVSEGTYAEFVRLSSAGSQVTEGATRKYRARATTAQGFGAPSSLASGHRIAGTVSFQWERSAGATATGFTPLASATTSTFDDTSAPAEGSVRWYRVVASASGAASVTSDAKPGSRQPPPGVPGNVSATTDLSDKVVVSWSVVPSAIGYHVYRNGQKMTTANGTQSTFFEDFAAPAIASTWAAPSGVQASSNDPDTVWVQWTAPTRPVGPSATYDVQAVNAAGDGGRSSSVSGNRAALPIVGFDVEVTPAGGNMTWVSTGSIEAAWTHLNAPAPTIIAGTATASQGTRRAVRLEAAGITVSPVPVTYRVRGALHGGAAFTPASNTASGQRMSGTLGYQWQRSGGESQGSFANLAGASSVAFDDNTAPVDGSARWYRLIVTAPGSDSVTLASVQGWRLSFVDVDGGSSHACAVTTGGVVWCWGNNAYGKLGRGPTLAGPAPAPIAMPAGVTGFSRVALHSEHSCALTSTGDVWCWGDNGAGQLGFGFPLQVSLPTKVVGLTGAALSLSTGNRHTCAVTSGGAVQCWGSNDSNFGVLGNNSADDSYQPIGVVTAGGTPLLNVLEVSAGSSHTCARRAGDMYCWGANDEGSLGNQTLAHSPVAVVVVGVGAGPAVDLGGRHSCAAVSNGVRCWGNNTYGQLGDGTLASNSTAVQVVNSTSTLMLTGLSGSTCAVTSTFSVGCWGRNDQGQLGNGNNTDSKQMVVVPALSNVLAIGSGAEFVCAVHGGSIACWGDNHFRQLGDGTNSDRSSPTETVFP